MSAADRGLSSLLDPRGVAVIGASPEQTRAGGRVLGYLTRYGYSGAIYPINPKYDSLACLPSYPSILDVPGPVDLAVVCVGAAHVPDVVRECGARGVGAVMVHSDGFTGELGDRLRQAWTEAGVRILGPNTNGLRVPGSHLYADASSGLATTIAEPGAVAILTQSGGLGSYFGSVFLGRYGVSAKYLVDTGNELDLDVAQVVTYLAGDDDLQAIGLIIESCRDGRALAAAVEHASARGKTVILLKLATTAASAEAAASHTGAIAGRFDVFQQVMVAAGARICYSPRQFTDAMGLFALRRMPVGAGIGVVTPSGGFGVLATDIGARMGIAFPQPAQPPGEELKRLVPQATFANPMDLSALQQNLTSVLPQSMEYLAGQPGIDSLVVWQPHGLLNPRLRDDIMAGLTAASKLVTLPVYLCGGTTPDVRDALWRDAHVVAFESPDDLLGVISVAVGGAAKPSPAHEVAAAKEPRAHDGVTAPSSARVVAGASARALLARAPQIEQVREQEVTSAEQALTFAAELGRPVMLKVQIEEQAHKSELGLVLGPVEGEAIRQAYATLAARRASLGIGVLTAEAFEVGVELALGALEDPSFGRIVMVGAGGRLIELLADVSFAPAPVTPQVARAMLARLRSYPVLTGFRGDRVRDIDAVVRAIVALSELICEPGLDFSQIDINPIIVREAGHGAVAVDCVFIG